MCDVKSEGFSEETAPDLEGVHITHCCVIHGCKYMEDDCPVANGTKTQAYACEDCTEYPTEMSKDQFRDELIKEISEILESLSDKAFRQMYYAQVLAKLEQKGHAFY